MWPDRRALELLGIDLPILLAPMANVGFADLAIAVANAGGLGALAAATLTPAQARAELQTIRAHTGAPINLNFFCHAPPVLDAAREAAWRARLAPYYAELGVDPSAVIAAPTRAPFDDTWCGLVEDSKPEVVSFHFGLPAPALLARVRATGAVILSSATTVDEAIWLEAQGCDAIIAQGAEAGGHRGVFLDDDPVTAVRSQAGTLALVPQIVDAVRVPVIAAGGRRRARHRRGVRARRRRGPARHGVSVVPRGADLGAAPRRAGPGQGQRDRADQRVHRPTGARPDQPRDARARPADRRRAGVPARRGRARAAQGRRRDPRLGRLRPAVVRASRAARARPARRRADPRARDRGARQASIARPSTRHPIVDVVVDLVVDVDLDGDGGVDLVGGSLTVYQRAIEFLVSTTELTEGL